MKEHTEFNNQGQEDFYYLHESKHLSGYVIIAILNE